MTPRRAAAWLCGCCALASALSLWRLGHNSYWLDEAFSVRLAQDPWPVFVRTVRTTEANMALYYLALRPWLRLGDGETAVRLFSCLAGILTVPILYAVGTRLFGRTTGLAAALLLAADTGRVWASQEARSYALVMCLATASWWLLLRAADVHAGTHAGAGVDGRTEASVPSMRPAARWALYIVAAALSVYAHFYAVLVLVAQAIAVLWLPMRGPGPARLAPRRVSGRIVAACSAALLVLLWPLVLFLRRPHHNIDWIAAAHQDRISAILSPVIHPTSQWGLCAVIALVVAGPLALAIGWSRVTVADRWRYTLVLLWLAVPVAVVVVISLVVAPVIDQRYLTICLPPLALAAAAALTGVWPRQWASVVLLLALTLDGASLTWYYTRFQKENWRDATAYILGHAQPGDQVVFYAPYTRIAFDLYRNRTQESADAPPREPARGRPLAAEVDQIRRTSPRVWLVLSHLDSRACAQAIGDDLESVFAQSEAREFSHIEVKLFSVSRNRVPPDTSRSPAACPQQ